jgi:hypothetical protein
MIYTGEALCELSLPYLESVTSVEIDGKAVEFSFKDGVIRFEKASAKKSVKIK